LTFDESLDSHNVSTVKLANRSCATQLSLVINKHCARPALFQAAAKLGTSQTERIAQDIEERGRRVAINFVYCTVDAECNPSHDGF
jgi:hypothetical protein